MNDKRKRGAGQPWKNDNLLFYSFLLICIISRSKRSRPYPIRFLKPTTMKELKLYRCLESFDNDKCHIIKGREYIIRDGELYGTRYNEIFDTIECFMNYGHVTEEEMAHFEAITFEDYFEDEED